MNTSQPSESRQKIDKLLQAFSELDALRSNVKTLDTLKTHADLARRAEEYILGFRQRLADIFQNPDPAFERFASMALRDGVDAATTNFSKNPEDYGQLKGWSLGPLNNAVRNVILKLSVPAAIRTATEGFGAHMQTGGGGITREELRRKSDAAMDKLAQAEEQFGSSAKRLELEMRIAELARDISFRDLAELPKDQYRLVETMRDKYRNLIQSMDGDPARRAAAAASKKTP
jgi:hypothetical protein